MSKKKLFHAVSRELAKINEQIDNKIIKGVSYRQDATRHKMLMSQLASARQRSGLARAFSFLSFL